MPLSQFDCIITHFRSLSAFLLSVAKRDIVLMGSCTTNLITQDERWQTLNEADRFFRFLITNGENLSWLKTKHQEFMALKSANADVLHNPADKVQSLLTNRQQIVERLSPPNDPPVTPSKSGQLG